jgi:hypothetical protein
MFSGNIGLLITNMINKKGGLFSRIKNYIPIKNLKFYHFLGVNIFAWLVKKTFFKKLNQKIQIVGKLNTDAIETLKVEMTISELCHLIGLFIIIAFQIIILVYHGMNHSFFFLGAMNIIFNLYPVLLQERNKARINRLGLIVKKS